MLASLATLSGCKRRPTPGRWGPLIPDPDGVLDLPAGFRYRVLERAGERMDDGFDVPARPDGMACFAGPDGTLILMRNHENGLAVDALEPHDAAGPYRSGQAVPPEAYDPAGIGAVTRVVVDARDYTRRSSNLVLAGTAYNCAGGPSPWGWLSCEETTEIRRTTAGDHRHGYVFACPIDAASVQPPQRIPAYGRFHHEAVAVDPKHHRAYLTEDRVDGCLYRFLPNDPSAPFVGRLQALAIVGEPNYNTTAMAVGEVLDVTWVDVEEPDPDDDSVRAQAKAEGAAVFVRGEGISWFAGQVYVCATVGGPIYKGQIFRLRDEDEPTLELVVASTDPEVLDCPDNITVAPWGELFAVEDGGGEQFIRWIGPEGEVSAFARNAVSESEMAGICFSPDGQAMFVNIQEDGLTLVVTGPFPSPSAG